MTAREDNYSVTLTRAELEALYGASFYATGHYGPPPDPPTPAMTAQEKIAKALGVSYDE